MTFRILNQSAPNPARSPFRIVNQNTGREIDWVNRYLDTLALRRMAPLTIRGYALSLLHFLRWWESVHHTATIALRGTFRFRSCSNTCAFSPVNNRRHPDPLSISASP